MWLIETVVYLLAAPSDQFAGMSNGWPHGARRYHYLMPIGWHKLQSASGQESGSSKH